MIDDIQELLNLHNSYHVACTERIDKFHLKYNEESQLIIINDKLKKLKSLKKDYENIITKNGFNVP